MGDMSEIREAILKEVRRRKMTIYQVAELVKGKVSQRTVYTFLRGEKDAKSETISIIMKALGLKIVKTTNRSKRSLRKER